MSRITIRTLDILFSLYFVGLMLSQSGADIFAALLAVAVLIYQKKNKPQSATPFAFPWNYFAAWVVVVAVGFLQSPATWHYGLSRVFEFKWIFLFYLMARYFVLTRPTPNCLQKISWVFLFVFIYSIATSVLGIDPFSNKDVENGIMRAGGFFSNPMFFAHVFGILLTLYSGTVLGKLKTKEAISNLEWATMIFGSIAMLLTMTRGIWIAGFFAVFVIVLYISRKAVGVFVLVSALVFSGLYFGWPSFKDRIHYVFASGSYDQERINLWTANWEIIKDNPVLGVGYGANKLLLDQYYDELGITEDRMRSHAHNQLIHLTAGTGLLGVGIFLIIYFYFLALTRKVYLVSTNSWHRRLMIGAIGAQICFLVGGFTEANFEHGRVKYAIIIVWSVILWVASENRMTNFRFLPQMFRTPDNRAP